MLYDIRKQKFINTVGYKLLEYDNYNLYYSGIIYQANGIKEGKESLNILIDEYESAKINFKNIYGKFVVLIENKKKKEIVVFTDNSSMTTIFYSDEFLGDNYIEMIQQLKNPRMNDKIVCEYLTLVRGYHLDTFVEGIEMMRGDYFYIIKNGQMCHLSKDVGSLGEESSIYDMFDFFQNMAKSLSQHKVISALTGGYDSRMLVASIKDKMQFDLFISGNNENSSDIRISKKVAERLSNKWTLYKTDMENIDKEQVLIKNFESSFGRACGHNSSTYRIMDFESKMNDKGYTILLAGEAGDMYKDFWWKQSFPFYFKRRVNEERFYSYRMELFSNKKILSNKLLKYYKVQKENIVEDMKKIKGVKSIKKYDIFGHHIWLKNAFCENISEGIIQYYPLQELELLKYSFLRPIREKYFNYLQRKVIVKAAPEISTIRTCYGTSASTKIVLLVGDVFIEVIEQIKRICRGVKRKLGYKERSAANVLIESEQDLKELSISKTALQYCKEMEYINEKVDLKEIPVSLLYKLIYLYLLGMVLKKK